MPPVNTLGDDTTALAAAPPRARRPRGLVPEIVDTLAADMREGRLQTGDKLPTESALMSRFEVSRTVVREAISRLQASGVVETPSFLFALELMHTTDMLSLQPAALIQKYVDRGLLSRIPVELPDRMPSYGLITRLGEPPTPAAQAFMDVLREAASRPMDGF